MSARAGQPTATPHAPTHVTRPHDLGHYRDAYRHLRHYTEIAPSCSWAWCWYGYACEAIGETEEARRATEEARRAYRRAIELEAAGHDETNAADRLAALERSRGAP